MSAATRPGGTFTMGGDLTVTRMGYGAMQLAGPRVFGPPADRDAALAVLRAAVELGITGAIVRFYVRFARFQGDDCALCPC
jgi:pyridoxine 4-dehydrogenase